MKTKYFPALASFVLAVATFITVSNALADPDRLDWADLLKPRKEKFPMNAPFDPNPTVKDVSQVDKLLVYAYDHDGNAVPVKTVKITNNHSETVYPVMRDGNEAATMTDPNVGLYDPYDAVRREYRGYIGYRDADGEYFFGLKPGKTILVRMPLVFWNGARIGIVTDGEFLTPEPGDPNPLSYDPNAQVIITDAEDDPSDRELIKNGVVMWYTAALAGPALDSPDQLAEWTIRDRDYLSNPDITARTHGEIPESEKVDLINYDVSYVDNMFLPVAMQALNVPIPAPPFPPGRDPQPYGWIGAVNTLRNLQKSIEDFTEPNNKLLGTYFDGKGWPIYNIPIDEIKIPAGQNIFAQSPLADARSSYNNNTYMLSSGGDARIPIFVNIGGEGTASSGNILTLSRNTPKLKIRFLRPGYKVVGYPPGGQSNPIQPGTKVVSVNLSDDDNVPSTVELDKPLVASQEGSNFDFFRPATDYASDALIKIWFTWADHYLENTKTVPSKSIEGAVVTDSATMHFAVAQDGLIEGMQVSGPGLPAADPSREKGGVVVLTIAEDKMSVTLSQLSSETHTLNEHVVYQFDRPQPLPSTPDTLFTLNFSSDPVEPERVPLEFSKKIYLIMASMAQIPKNPDPAVKTPHVLELMNNVIGGNMGFIFDTNEQRFSESGLAIAAIIRDMIKSVLRGVTDFTKFSEYDDANKRVWYPDPKVPRGGQTFNIFNLDPFVWFVHVDLGFSGYGFSLDDDTADVGAGEATKLLMTIGGPPDGQKGPSTGRVTTRENANEWTIQAPYGPVAGTGEWDPDARQSFYLGITEATNTTPIRITSVKHGLTNGEKVFIDQVVGNTNANSQNDVPFAIKNVTENTFELVGTSGNGNYVSGGRWTRGPLPYITFTKRDIDGVYWRVKGDDRNAGFQGALMSGPGIQGKGSVRVVQLGDDTRGQLAISKPLTLPGGRPLPAGKNYRWIFSGN